jgi:uncharacterized damage-inducible protein DinB
MRVANGLGFFAVTALAATFITPAAGRAQPQAHGEYARHATTPAVVEALLRDIAMLEGKLIGLAEAIPEEKYDWRPAAGVRSVREVMTHVAADNYFLPTFAALAAPETTGIKSGDYPSVQAYENRSIDKAAAVRALRDSFAHLRTGMQGVDEAFLARSLDVFGNRMSGLDLWVMTTTHLHEHLGQSIAYARSNGVVPPWSR